MCTSLSWEHRRSLPRQSSTYYNLYSRKNAPAQLLRLTSLATSPKDISNYMVIYLAYLQAKYLYKSCIMCNQPLTFSAYLRGIHAMWWSYHSFPILSKFHLISHPSSWFAALFSSQVRHPCIGETVGHLKTRLRRQIPAGGMIQCLSSNPKCPNRLGWLKVHDSSSKTFAAKCSVG